MSRYPPTMTTVANYALCQRGERDPDQPNQYFKWIGSRMVVPFYLMNTTFTFFPVQSVEPPSELKFVPIDHDTVAGAPLVSLILQSRMFLNDFANVGKDHHLLLSLRFLQQGL